MNYFKRKNYNNIVVFFMALLSQIIEFSPYSIIIILVSSAILYNLYTLLVLKRYSSNENNIKCFKTLGWYGLFCVLILISTLYTVNTINISFVITRVMFALVISLIVSQSFDEEKGFMALLNGLIVGGIISIVIILYTQWNVIGIRRLGDDLFGSATDFSYVLALSLYSVIWKLVYIEKRKIFNIVILAILFLFVLFSGTRRGMISPFIFGFIIVLLLKRYSITKKVWIIAGVLTIIVFALFIVINNSYLFNIIGWRLESMLQFLGGETKADLSMTERSIMTQYGFKLFMERPIFGYGIHAFAYKFLYHYGKYLYSHNGITEILSCYGIVGMFLFYRVYFTIFKDTRIIVKDNNGIGVFFLAFSILTLVSEPSTISFLVPQTVMLLGCALKFVDSMRTKTLISLL